MKLSLVPPGPSTVPPVPPVVAGDVVHVVEPVHYPSGRVLRPGHYTVVRVEGDGHTSPCRVVVRARLDPKHLDKRFKPSETPDGWHVPLCCEPTEVYVEAADWTAYAGDWPGVRPRGPVSIPDRPQRDSATPPRWGGPGSFSS